MSAAPIVHRLAGDLVAHQQRILATTGELLALLAQSSPAALASASLRWRMARELREYQLFKHQCVFAPLIAGDGLVGQLARTMKQRCERIGQRVEHYIRHWSGRDVAAAWSEHRDATAQLLAAIEQHAGIERREIEQLWQLRAA